MAAPWSVALRELGKKITRKTHLARAREPGRVRQSILGVCRGVARGQVGEEGAGALGGASGVLNGAVVS